MNQSQVDRMSGPRGFVPARQRLAAAGGLALGATLALAGSANAATFQVNKLGDAGSGTLRQAILDANGNGTADTISFASGLTGTITLTSGPLTITDAVDVQGPGAAQLSVSGNNASQVFYVKSPASGSVTISGLTLTGGFSSGHGGAIEDTAILTNFTLSGLVVSGNHADYAGGIDYNGTVPFTLRSSTVSGNTATHNTGGLYVGSGATIQNCTIANNTGQDFGSGMYLYTSDKPITVENTTVTGNHALNGNGGGVSAHASGTGSIAFIGSTIAGNSAVNPSGTAKGGGIFDVNPINPITLHDTIVAGNKANLAPDASAVFNSAFSLIQDPSGAVVNDNVPGSTITGQNPQLGALADNGGPAQTMALAATSPAVDKGSAFGLTGDQRGVQRPIDLASVPNSTAAGADGSDIGAFELQPSNGFSLGKLKRNKTKGTAVQTVKLALPDNGTVTVSGKFLKKQTKAAKANGILSLKLIAKGKGKKKLRNKGKSRFSEQITYDPVGQSPNSITKKVKLLKKLRQR
jgi:parallel beta-helix repeat protein